MAAGKPKERQAFCALVRAGVTIAEAAHAVGVQYRVAHRWAVLAGLCEPARLRVARELAAVRALADGIRTSREIGLQVGLSETKVWRIVRRNGLPVAPIGRPRADAAVIVALTELATPSATHRVVAEALGYSPTWVARQRRRLGLPRARGGRPAAAFGVAW